jgi:hypothetical protein
VGGVGGLTRGAAGARAQVDVFAVDTEGYDLEIVKQLLGTRLRPAVVFIEVGLLSPADQRAAERALGAEGYATRRCGYGMELLAVRPPPLPPVLTGRVSSLLPY